MVTIADVAARAGVAVSTVSRVINNSPQVREQTRERVLAAIASLDYHPNPLARGLSRGRCRTLGVVVPFCTDSAVVERLRGIVAAVDAARYDVAIFNVEAPLHRDEHLSSLTAGGDGADGAILVSLPPRPSDLERLAAAGIPLVLLDTRHPGIPSIVTDDVEGGRIATRHLVDLGHEQIAFVGDDPGDAFGFSGTAQREQGYREALADAGIPVRNRLVRHGVRPLLASKIRPSAVFAASDLQALGVVEAARAAGLDVPRDLSVVGFDDVPMAAWAGLTTVRRPLFESGYLAASILLELLEGTPPPSEEHELTLELVERHTTAPAGGRRG